MGVMRRLVDDILLDMTFHTWSILGFRGTIGGKFTLLGAHFGSQKWSFFHTFAESLSTTIISTTWMVKLGGYPKKGQNRPKTAKNVEIRVPPLPRNGGPPLFIGVPTPKIGGVGGRGGGTRGSNLGPIESWEFDSKL
jgi:hypothetical protein